MQYVKNQLPLRKAISFFHAVRDEDCFTILWELAESSPKPIPFESMRRTFGADPRYLSEVLDRLQNLGIATKAGRQWTVYNWAKTTLEYLEEAMKDVRIEVTEANSPGAGTYTNDFAVGTQNGFWIGVAPEVTAYDRLAAGNPRTASANDATELEESPELVNKPQNEARSYDYK